MRNAIRHKPPVSQSAVAYTPAPGRSAVPRCNAGRRGQWSPRSSPSCCSTIHRGVAWKHGSDSRLRGRQITRPSRSQLPSPGCHTLDSPDFRRRQQRMPATRLGEGQQAIQHSDPLIRGHQAIAECQKSQRPMRCSCNGRMERQRPYGSPETGKESIAEGEADWRIQIHLCCLPHSSHASFISLRRPLMDSSVGSSPVISVNAEYQYPLPA